MPFVVGLVASGWLLDHQPEYEGDAESAFAQVVHGLVTVATVGLTVLLGVGLLVFAAFGWLDRD